MTENVVFEVPNFQVIAEERDVRGARQRLNRVARPPVALMIPFVGDEEVVLIRSLRAGFSEKIVEFPAGRVEEAEVVAAAAVRELLEEVGFVTDRIVQVGELLTAPHFSDEKISVFACRGVITVAQELTETEEIQVFTVNRNQVSEMILSGVLRDAKSIAAWSLLLASEAAGDMSFRGVR